MSETETMKAWVMTRVTDMAVDAEPLECISLPVPEPSTGEIRIRVSVCGVCHTELDEIEGRSPPPSYPMVPGHQVVGVVDAKGKGARRHAPGARVGVAWIYAACGQCEWCQRGEENLCPDFLATGRDVNGGYAEYMVVPERFAYPLPAALSDAQVAPLLCAGAIGYRSLMLSELVNGQALGLTGFGASAHLTRRFMSSHAANGNDSSRSNWARAGQARQGNGRRNACRPLSIPRRPGPLLWRRWPICCLAGAW
jgi:propanol-preferring alcohol dehydrogenase